MTKKQFKTRWESNDDGGGITFNDIAECAKAWGINNRPFVARMDEIRYTVLKTANVNDLKDFEPNQ